MKNSLTVTEGIREGIMEGQGARDFRNSYKGHMDITNGGVESGEGRGDGLGGV